MQFGDHPRSRGVYDGQVEVVEDANGSSPLARGLPCINSGNRFVDRIIPARAGFTRTSCRSPCPARDHPRSRGVYLLPCCTSSALPGSSPLARGLPLDVRGAAHAAGIIPARAGFTQGRQAWRPASPDHPRSRGVYTCGSLESQRRATLPDLVCLHCRPSARSAEFR